jgi:hypothetical protein
MMNSKLVRRTVSPDTFPLRLFARRRVVRLVIWSALFPALTCLDVGRAAAQDVHPDRPAGRLVAGGVLGLLAGAAAGALTGTFLYSSSCTGYCETGGIAAVGGAAVGATIGIPLGVHLGNDRRGSFPLSLVSTLAIAGAGLGGALLVETMDSDAAVGAGYVALGVAVPLAQITASILIHRRARPR